MFSETVLIPNVNGGPRNCMACSDTSVNTRTCCLVSTAVTISEPEPIVEPEEKGASWFILVLILMFIILVIILITWYFANKRSKY